MEKWLSPCCISAPQKVSVPHYCVVVVTVSGNLYWKKIASAKQCAWHYSKMVTMESVTLYVPDYRCTWLWNHGGLLQMGLLNTNEFYNNVCIFEASYSSSLWPLLQIDTLNWHACYCGGQLWLVSFKCCNKHVWQEKDRKYLVKKNNHK